MKTATLLLALVPGMSLAVTTLSDPSTAWTSLGANYDYLVDQQTGQAAGDIVGSNPAVPGANPGFFVSYDDGSDPIPVDDFIQFRVRLDDHGGNNNSPEFDRNLWVGIDADLDGAIDGFVGVNRQGASNESAIYSPGSDLNISPSTTSISNSPYASYTLNSSNYDYRPVNVGIDGGTTDDMTTATSGDPDYYVSFAIPMADLTNFFASLATPLTFNKDTTVQYILATSTQANSLNQDLGGIDGGVNSSETWEDLGGFSPQVTGGGEVVPEPGVPALLASFAVILLCGRARRRH